MSKSVRVDGALRKIKSTSLLLKAAIPPAMNRAGLQFIGDIQEEFYSGRKPDDTGLNVVTNRLRDSWFPFVTGQGVDVVLMVRTDVNYAKIHEEGGEHIPKRTDVVKTWEENIRQLILDEVGELG